MGILRRHRHWVFLISAAVVVLAAATVISLTVVERVSKGPAFTSAAEFIRNDPLARQQLGVISGFGLGVAGGVRESGPSGSADLSFDVDGSWRNGRANVVVRKKAGLWLVVSATLEVDGETFELPGQPMPL
jgi:cytochrome oxidase complex assembly protein 1